MSYHSHDQWFTTYFQRIVRPTQMDFDSALATMVTLLRDPAQVPLTARYRKLTKNHWARDDPAFVVLLVFYATVVTFAYWLTLTSRSVSTLLSELIIQIVVLFLGFGLVATSILWWSFNRRLASPSTALHTTRQELEWFYVFDLYSHGFFVTTAVLGVLQFIFLPLLVHDNFVSLLVGNTLWAGGLAAACVVVFSGLAPLPFLEERPKLAPLLPLPILALLWVIGLLFGINFSRTTLGWLFPSPPSIPAAA